LFSHPPDVAAMISKREDKYYVAPQDGKGRVRVNGTDSSAQHELNEGDVVQVWKVKMAFSWHESASTTFFEARAIFVRAFVFAHAADLLDWFVFSVPLCLCGE